MAYAASAALPSVQTCQQPGASIANGIDNGVAIMRKELILLGLLWCAATPAMAELNIGINVSIFPQLQVVPGSPVYYAPDLPSNYFFYDGAYWVYQDDNWYSSAWYDGPWDLIDPNFVPLYVLRVPVQYYRQPPQYFRSWQRDAPPRWGEHWGSGWSQRRSGWDHWDRRAAPAPAPLPVYQRQYAGDRYPAPSQQKALQSKNGGYRGSAERDRPQQSSQRTAPTVTAAPVNHASSQPYSHEPARGQTPATPPPQQQYQQRQQMQQQQQRQLPPRDSDRPPAPARAAPQQAQPSRGEPQARPASSPEQGAGRDQRDQRDQGEQRSEKRGERPGNPHEDNAKP
jgi:hypothetical protein